MSACPSCSREIAEGFAFCPYCGAATTMPAAGEERKLVTILFADISGSTRLSEDLDAEAVRDLMASYFALAREEIEARGGTVEKFIGDAVMSVFGVPVAHEDDPSRALHAALAIRRRLAELNAQLRAESRPELRVRIGISSGEVVSTLGARPGEVMVTGDPVNVAARVQQMAEPDQVLVTQRTASAAPGFRYGPAGQRDARGKAVPVDVAELIDEIPEHSGRPHVRAPLVGREQELALLSSIFDRVARERRPYLVTLYGQPGVGKSRLTAEFLATLARLDDPPRVIRGRCLSYGTGVTFWPLAEILKAEAGILDADAPSGAVAKLEALAGRLGKDHAEARRTAALLGSTVGISIPGHDFGHIDPEVLRGEILEAWRTFFSALAADGPLIAVIEDIHWAEPALLDILSDLGARAQGSVLILCPARPELVDRSPTWGGGRPSFSAIFLDPLERDDASRLVGVLLETENLPGDLHDRIVERAGGNPFFAEEIIRHLLDRRRLEGGDARSGGGSEIALLPIPDTVQAVIAARIDLLEPDEKHALQAAAVVGRIFWPAPVARYLETTPQRAVELLRALESRDLVLSRLDSSMRGQAEFIFKHALVRDVAYESIPKRDRAMAHLEIVRWIEEAIGERRLEVVELLAYHYTAAQRAAAWGRVEPDRREEIRARAVELLFDAADEAGRLFAMDRAAERVSTGLELAKGPIERARGLEAMAKLALWQDDGDEAWRLAREATDLRVAAPGPPDRRAIARLCGQLLAMPTRWPGLLRSLPTRAEAEPYLALGFSMLDPGDSEERLGLLLAKAAWGWGFAEADRDPARNEEYRAAANEAVALARRLRRADLLSAALDTAGAVFQEIGGYGLANRYQLERLELIPELDDPAEVADIIGTLAWHFVHIGEYRRATELMSAGAASRYGLEMPVLSHRTKIAFSAVAHFRLGEWDRFWSAFADLDAIVDPERAVSYHLMRLYGIAAYLREVGGDRSEADRLVAILDASQETRGDTGVSGARLWIVEILVRRGEFGAARRRLAVADPARETQNLDLTYEAWGELLAEEGAWAEAPAIVAAAREWAARGGLLALPAFADRLEGRMLVAGGDPERGVDLLRSARDTFEALEGVWDRARTELHLAGALLSIGRMTEAGQVADRALATLERLEAPAEVARAHALRRQAG